MPSAALSDHSVSATAPISTPPKPSAADGLLSRIMKPLRDQVNEMTVSVRLMDKRQFAHQVLSLALIVCSALMIWKALILYTGSESPVVVVLSGSMEPAFYRGDILFLRQSEAPFVIGDIVVFKVRGKDIPIVHRVHEIHCSTADDGSEHEELLTKGDNNHVHDSWGIYNPGQHWLHRQDIMGRAVGFLPYLGMITIWLTDYPLVKFLLLGTMAVFVIFAKDQ